PEDGLHEQAVGARRAGPVDVGELEGEVVDLGDRGCAHWLTPLMATSGRLFAYGITRSNFCMSHAAVGQRSAHRPQCTHTFSSFTITRPVCGSAPDTNRSCSVLAATTVSRLRSSSSSPLGAMVRQVVGQT